MPSLTGGRYFHKACAALQAEALPSTDPANLGRQEDGYRAARGAPDGMALLREQLLALLQGARFWDKACDWMQVRLSGH